MVSDNILGTKYAWLTNGIQMEIKRNLLQICLLGVLLLQMVSATTASQMAFTNLFNFSGSNGAYPQATLTLSGSTLYGTTTELGVPSTGYGTVFRIKIDGTGFSNLYNFTATASDPSTGANTNGGGAYPQASLIISGSTLYGTATSGGAWGNGTVFAINTNGTGFTNLYSFSKAASDPSLGQYTFTNSDGANPYGSLILSGSTLYGTTYQCGSGGGGTVFSVNTDGTGFTNLCNFNGTNGAFPQASLLLSGSTLYGTTYGGVNGSVNGGGGTVFAINTNGIGLTNLYRFTTPANNGGYVYTNSGGAYPQGSLIISGGRLYGTTYEGGSGGGGTVFAINTNGTGFTNLCIFDGSNGAYPKAGLIFSSTTLYGTTSQGGSWGNGTVFAINTDGTGFTNLYSFTSTYPAFGIGTGSTNSDGANPYDSLVLSGSILYGTTQLGGIEGYGIVFALTLPPPNLNIQPANGAVILNWNDPAATYILRAATSVDGVYTNVTGATSPYTNSITGSQQFFRLQSAP
jgi:uncharacterized repeat protein (TIGR03803 family)